MKEKVMLALSGGVDSSVCVSVLRNMGYEVLAVVMKMSDAHEGTVNAAKKVSDELCLPLTVLDLRDEFNKNVISPFISDYLSARTPNPCVICNPLVKFRNLIKCADENGCRFIATGHYASVGCENGRYYITRSQNSARDQSYMLYRLEQDVLSRLILPIGNMEKEAVREVARSLSLSSANSPDSQENCFIPDNDYAKFIEERHFALPEGDFISPDGDIIGKHRGIHRYTVGQRKGLNIAFGEPVYIKEIDAETNRIYLCRNGGQYSDEIEVENCVFMLKDFSDGISADVKIRSAAKETVAVLTRLENGNIKAKFSEKVKAPTPGQSAVFYIDGKILGGGFIV